VPGKKKATGLSKRQSFLDRNVIAENKAIMRFNEDLAEAARGVERTRGSEGEPERGSGRQRRSGPVPSSRPARTARPTLPPEQETALRTAVAEAAAGGGAEAAGAGLVDSLSRGDRFERASEAGWRVLAEDPMVTERSSQEWDRLRLAWAAVRRAALAEWVKTHPDAAELQEKEAKAAARADRTTTRRPAVRRTRPQRPRPEVSAKSVAADCAADPAAQAPDGAETGDPAPATAAGADEKRRRPRRRRPRRGGQPVVAGGVSAEPPDGREAIADAAAEPGVADGVERTAVELPAAPVGNVELTPLPEVSPTSDSGAGQPPTADLSLPESSPPAGEGEAAPG